MGLHYLPEGKALIERITQQMNNYRLSTFKHTISSDTLRIPQGGY